MQFLGLALGRKTITLQDFAVADKKYSDKIMLASLFATLVGSASTCGVVSGVYKPWNYFFHSYLWHCYQ
ncbi:MAG: hypothetical protein ACTSXG_00775 [Alphaproteobacteria bacterium]